jgi:hypothetical protein
MLSVQSRRMSYGLRRASALAGVRAVVWTSRVRLGLTLGWGWLGGEMGAMEGESVPAKGEGGGFGFVHAYSFFVVKDLPLEI